MSAPKSPLMTYKEAAEFLDRHPNTVSRWVEKGIIKRIDGTRFLSRAEVERVAGIQHLPKPPESRKRGPYKKTLERLAKEGRV